MVNTIGDYDENTTNLEHIEGSNDETGILDGQTAKESENGLRQVAEEKQKDTEEKQPEIKNLTNQLNDVPTMETELFAKFSSGVAVYKALKKEGEGAIQKKIEEFNAYNNYYHGNGERGIQDTAYLVRQNFSTLLTKSDEETDTIYLKYFEPQNSIYSFGKLLADATDKAFVNGFFAARNGTPEQGLSDDLKLTAKIIDKLTAAQRRHHERYYEKIGRA